MVLDIDWISMYFPKKSSYGSPNLSELELYTGNCVWLLGNIYSP